MSACVFCPACGGAVRLPEAHLGRLVECPRCRHRWTAEAEEPTGDRIPTRSWERPPPRADHHSDEPLDEDLAEALTNPPRRDWLPHRGGLVLTLGILALCLCAIPPAGILLGASAAFMGYADLAAIRRNEMEPDGRPLTLGGTIAGLVGIVLSLLILAMCAGVWTVWYTPTRPGRWPGGPPVPGPM